MPAEQQAAGVKGALTRKIGPLPTWGWTAIIGGGVLGWAYWKNRKGASQSSATVPNTTPPTVFLVPDQTTPPAQEDNDADDTTGKGKGKGKDGDNDADDTGSGGNGNPGPTHHHNRKHHRHHPTHHRGVRPGNPNAPDNPSGPIVSGNGGIPSRVGPPVSTGG